VKGRSVRPADRGFSAVNGDGPMHAGGRQAAAILQQVLDVLHYQVDRHYKQPTITLNLRLLC